MVSLLMAIFVWFASLFGAADQARPQPAQPVKVVAKATPKPVSTEWVCESAAAPAPAEPLVHFASTLPPAAIQGLEHRDAMVQVQDAKATMCEAMADVQTIRVSTAAGRCDRTLIIRSARLRAPMPPTVPMPLAASCRNS